MAAGDFDLGMLLPQLLTGGLNVWQGLGNGQLTDRGTAQQAANLADPFASQRPQYQGMLSNYLTNPGSFKADPGYQFALSQGQDAIKGAGNAIYGGTRAGAIYPELAKFTEGYANQAYDNRIGQLLTASGATSGSPGTAGALYAQGGYKGQSDLGSGLGNLFGSLFGNAGSTNGGLVGLLAPLFKGLWGNTGAGGMGDYTGSNADFTDQYWSDAPPNINGDYTNFGSDFGGNDFGLGSDFGNITDWSDFFGG